MSVRRLDNRHVNNIQIITVQIGDINLLNTYNESDKVVSVALYIHLCTKQTILYYINRQKSEVFD